MKSCWQPIIPIRWHKKEDGTLVLQQAWADWHIGQDEWFQGKEHKWVDVPIDINDPNYWIKEITE